MTAAARPQDKNLELRLERATAHIQENRLDAAEKELRAVLRTAPREARAVNLLGAIRAMQGRLAEAEPLFLRAIRIDERLAGARMNLAYLYLLKGEPLKTMRQLEAVLRLEPNNNEALLKLARLQLSQGQLDDCINLVEKSKQTQAPTPPVLTLLGEAYLRKGDNDKAEESFLLAVSQQENSMEAVLGLAQVAHARGNAQSRSVYMSRARTLAGESPDLLYRYAVVALKAAQYEDARAALEQAIRLKPAEAAYHIALGAVWLKKPDLFEGERNFRRALELDPKNSQAQMYTGYTLLKLKKYPEARVHLEKSIQYDQSQPEPFYYLALIAQEQNEEARAVEILEKLTRRFPEYSSAHLALGASYLKLKNYPRAREELELAVKLNPTEPKAHYNLALLYARIKEPKRAQEAMQMVEKLKNNSAASAEGDLAAPVPRPPSPH